MSLILYSKEHCHLCDEALALLEHGGLSAVVVDVEADDQLMAIYGLRIPVLVLSDGRELGWPFDADQLDHFIRG